MDVAAIVPAAGSGRRMGGAVAKPFLPLLDRPVLAHTLAVLQASSAIRWIVLVIREHERSQAQRLLARYRITKALPPCAGGASRAESVAHGLAAAPAAARWILIHDGARPCVTQRLVSETVRAAARHGAVACGVPASLTVKAVDEQRQVRLTLDRESLWFVQTPQMFRRDWAEQAMASMNGRLGSFPDDAAVLEAAGFSVTMVPGDPLNLKVTTPEDLVLAEAILRSRVQKSEVRGRKSEGRIV